MQKFSLIPQINFGHVEQLVYSLVPRLSLGFEERAWDRGMGGPVMGVGLWQVPGERSKLPWCISKKTRAQIQLVGLGMRSGGWMKERKNII